MVHQTGMGGNLQDFSHLTQIRLDYQPSTQRALSKQSFSSHVREKVWLNKSPVIESGAPKPTSAAAASEVAERNPAMLHSSERGYHISPTIIVWLIVWVSI